MCLDLAVCVFKPAAGIHSEMGSFALKRIGPCTRSITFRSIHGAGSVRLAAAVQRDRLGLDPRPSLALRFG